MRWPLPLALALLALPTGAGAAQQATPAVTLHAIRGAQGPRALRVLRRCLAAPEVPPEEPAVQGWGRLRHRRATGWELTLFLRSGTRRWRHRERRPTLRALLRAASRECARWTAPPGGQPESRDEAALARRERGEPGRPRPGASEEERRGPRRRPLPSSGPGREARDGTARDARRSADERSGRQLALSDADPPSEHAAEERGTGSAPPGEGARTGRAAGGSRTVRAEADLGGPEVMLGLGGGLFFRGLSWRGADASRADHQLVGPRVLLDARARGGRGPLGRLSGQLQLALGVATATRDATGALHPTRHHAVDAHVGVDLRRTERTRVALRVGGHSQRVHVDDGPSDATRVPDVWYRAASLGALLEHAGVHGGLRLALGLRWPFRVPDELAEGGAAAGFVLEAEARVHLAPGLALSLGGRFEPTFVWHRQQLGAVDAEAGARDLTGQVRAALHVRWPSR